MGSVVFCFRCLCFIAFVFNSVYTMEDINGINGSEINAFFDNMYNQEIQKKNYVSVDHFVLNFQDIKDSIKNKNLYEAYFLLIDKYKDDEEALDFLLQDNFFVTTLKNDNNFLKTILTEKIFLKKILPNFIFPGFTFQEEVECNFHHDVGYALDKKKEIKKLIYEFTVKKISNLDIKFFDFIKVKNNGPIFITSYLYDYLNTLLMPHIENYNTLLELIKSNEKMLKEFKTEKFSNFFTDILAYSVFDNDCDIDKVIMINKELGKIIAEINNNEHILIKLLSDNNLITTLRVLLCNDKKGYKKDFLNTLFSEHNITGLIDCIIIMQEKTMQERLKKFNFVDVLRQEVDGFVFDIEAYGNFCKNLSNEIQKTKSMAIEINKEKIDMGHFILRFIVNMFVHRMQNKKIILKNTNKNRSIIIHETEEIAKYNLLLTFTPNQCINFKNNNEVLRLIDKNECDLKKIKTNNNSNLYIDLFLFFHMCEDNKNIFTFIIENAYLFKETINKKEFINNKLKGDLYRNFFINIIKILQKNNKFDLFLLKALLEENITSKEIIDISNFLFNINNIKQKDDVQGFIDGVISLNYDNSGNHNYNFYHDETIFYDIILSYVKNNTNVMEILLDCLKKNKEKLEKIKSAYSSNLYINMFDFCFFTDEEMKRVAKVKEVFYSFGTLTGEDKKHDAINNINENICFLLDNEKAMLLRGYKEEALRNFFVFNNTVLLDYIVQVNNIVKRESSRENFFLVLHTDEYIRFYLKEFKDFFDTIITQLLINKEDEKCMNIDNMYINCQDLIITILISKIKRDWAKKIVFFKPQKSFRESLKLVNENIKQFLLDILMKEKDKIDVEKLYGIFTYIPTIEPQKLNNKEQAGIKEVKIVNPGVLMAYKNIIKTDLFSNKELLRDFIQKIVKFDKENIFLIIDKKKLIEVLYNDFFIKYNHTTKENFINFVFQLGANYNKELVVSRYDKIMKDREVFFSEDAKQGIIIDLLKSLSYLPDCIKNIDNFENFLGKCLKESNKCKNIYYNTGDLYFNGIKNIVKRHNKEKIVAIINNPGLIKLDEFDLNKELTFWEILIALKKKFSAIKNEDIYDSIKKKDFLSLCSANENENLLKKIVFLLNDIMQQTQLIPLNLLFSSEIFDNSQIWKISSLCITLKDIFDLEQFSKLYSDKVICFDVIDKKSNGNLLKNLYIKIEASQNFNSSMNENDLLKNLAQEAKDYNNRKLSLIFSLFNIKNEKINDNLEKIFESIKEKFYNKAFDSELIEFVEDSDKIIKFYENIKHEDCFIDFTEFFNYYKEKNNDQRLTEAIQELERQYNLYVKNYQPKDEKSIPKSIHGVIYGILKSICNNVVDPFTKMRSALFAAGTLLNRIRLLKQIKITPILILYSHYFDYLDDKNNQLCENIIGDRKKKLSNVIPFLKILQKYQKPFPINFEKKMEK